MLIVAIAVVALLMLFVSLATIADGVTMGTHADVHSMADAVRNCPKSSLGMTLINPADGRRVDVCEFKLGEWGRLVTEEDNGKRKEVTAYADSQSPTRNSLRSVVENLGRTGYTKVEFMRSDLVTEVIRILAGQ
jgi:hypothetical protein